MAHECPECGSLCHCRGDIDDCLLNADEAVDSCEHCDPYDDGPDALFGPCWDTDTDE